MGKIIRLFLSAVVFAGTFTACGDNKDKNKLLNGTFITGDGAGGILLGGGGGGDVLPSVQAATAAQIAVVSAQMSGSGSQASNMLAPAAAPTVYQILPGSTYDPATGYYSMGNISSGEGSVGAFKMRFSCSLDQSLVVFGTNGTASSYFDAASFALVKYIRCIVTGNNPEGNAFTANNRMTVGGTFDLASNLLLSGTVAISGPCGTYTFTSTNLMVCGSGTTEGVVLSGTQSGSGTLRDGTPVTYSMTLNSGQADGTATFNGTTITIHINANGTGTYTDSTGVHNI